MNGLVNGLEAFEDHERVVEVEVVRDVGDYRVDIVVRRSEAGRTVWRTGIDAIGPDPTSSAGDAVHCDFKAMWWNEGRSLIVGGSDRAVVLDEASGVEVVSVPVEFTFQPSLDVMKMVAVRAVGLVVASTRSISLLDVTRNIRWTRSGLGLVQGVEVREGEGVIAVEQLDTTNASLPRRLVLVKLSDGSINET